MGYFWMTVAVVMFAIPTIYLMDDILDWGQGIYRGKDKDLALNWIQISVITGCVGFLGASLFQICFG